MKFPISKFSRPSWMLPSRFPGNFSRRFGKTRTIGVSLFIPTVDSGVESGARRSCANGFKSIRFPAFESRIFSEKSRKCREILECNFLTFAHTFLSQQTVYISSSYSISLSLSLHARIRELTCSGKGTKLLGK